MNATSSQGALVSILIPCHNAAPWLTETLESALAQTWTEKEIILVDDGSTDRSLDIARTFEPRGVRVLTQRNAGASAARNRALAEARGGFIQYLDADDLLAPNKIAGQMARLAGATDAIAAGPWGAFTTSPADAVFNPEPVWADFPPIDWLVCSWSGGGMMQPGVWLTPRAVATAAGPWNEALSLDDDGEYFCRVLLAARSVRFVADARTYYRRSGPHRLSASKGRRAAESSFRSCSAKEKLLLAAEDSRRTRHALACNYRRLAWEQLAAAPDLAARAIRRWQELDPGVPVPQGGPKQAILARLIGWQAARRLQLLAQRLRHG